MQSEFERREHAVEEPLYNIGVVSRMTGVPVATLRVWERRYGFPSAARTEGRQRIYSAREVQRLRWVKARVDAGMQPAKAVHALRMMEERPETDAAGARGSPEEVAAIPSGGLAVFRERLTAALLAHDLEDAGVALGDATAVATVEHVLLEVVRPALVAVGDAWRDGTASVATEHLATQFLRQRLTQWLASAPAPRGGAPVVLACAPGEWHDLGLLMLAVLLARRRWPVVFLGQAVPLADLAAFVTATQPAVVVLAATRDATARALADWQFAASASVSAAAPLGAPGDLSRSTQVDGTSAPPAIAYAGRAFVVRPALRARMPGVYLGDRLDDAVPALERLLATSSPTAAL